MQAFREPTEQTVAQPTISLPFAPNLLVSASALPLLLGLVSGRALADSLTQLGRSSEEFFRGDRLPPLPLMKTDVAE